MSKVVFISSYPPLRGKLSEYAYSLIIELQKSPNINHIDILAETVDSKTTEEVNDKTTIHKIWKSDNPISLLSIPFKIMALRPNIVHFNVHMAVFGRSRISNFIGLSLPTICKIMGFKTVTTLHNTVDTIDVEKTGYSNNFINRLSAFFVTKLIALSSTVTLTMRSHSESFKKRYKCRSVKTIPHGTWNNGIAIKRENCKTESILYIGHSGPYKNLDLLFETFNLLESKDRRLKLILAGNSHPNYPGFLDQYKKINRENILFTGYVPDDQLQALFEKANAVLLPYRTCTGTSGVVHLASSYGTPIVATDLPEFRELANEGCGLLISSHCAKSLAENVERIIDNPKLALELREKNFTFASSRSWDVVASHFCSLYDELLDK